MDWDPATDDSMQDCVFPDQLFLVKYRIIFDVLCLATTGLLTCLMLGYLDGLGIGTIVAAFTMGKMVSITGSWIDQRVTFASVLSKQTI